jgi:hypothetical protein
MIGLQLMLTAKHNATIGVALLSGCIWRQSALCIFVSQWIFAPYAWNYGQRIYQQQSGY